MSNDCIKSNSCYPYIYSYCYKSVRLFFEKAGYCMKIEAVRLSKTYPGGNKALDEVSFKIDKNGIFSLIGKNGAGKTTLVRILSTQLFPTSGRAVIDSWDVVEDARQIRERIAAVPQEARAVPWMTPVQTVTSYLMWRGYTHSESRSMAMDTLRKFSMEKYENEKNRKLSGGQKRKVLVATALSSEADLIFLDEPTTGLDFISRKELWDVFSNIRKERSIVLTTHYLEEAEMLADHIGVLNEGKLVGFGTLNELRKLAPFPFTIKAFSPEIDIPEGAGKVVALSGDQMQILAHEDDVFNIVSSLIARRIMFTVQESSLNTIFETLVYGGGED